MRKTARPRPSIVRTAATSLRCAAPAAHQPAALVVDIQDAVLNEFTGSTETKVDAAESAHRAACWFVELVDCQLRWNRCTAGSNSLLCSVDQRADDNYAAGGRNLSVFWSGGSSQSRSAKSPNSCKQWSRPGCYCRTPRAGLPSAMIWTFCITLLPSWAASCRPRWNRHIIIKSSLISPRSNTYRRRSIRTFCTTAFTILYRMAKMEDTDGIAEMSLKLSSYYRYITRSAQPVVYPGDGVPEHCGLYRDTDHPLW